LIKGSLSDDLDNMSKLIYKRVTNLLMTIVTYCFYWAKSSPTIEWE